MGGKILVCMTSFILMLCVSTSLTIADTYYVDADSVDGCNGTDQTTFGTPDCAWNDLSDIIGLVAGDTVLLKRGGRWNESLYIQTDGITISNYGSVSDQPPLIDGEGIRFYGIKIISSNIRVDGLAFRNQKFIYQNEESYYCNQYFESGSILVMGSKRLYYYDNERPYCSYNVDNVQSVTNIVISNLTVDNTESNGINIIDANNVTVSNCTVSNIVDVDGDKKAGSGIIFDNVDGNDGSSVRYCYINEIYGQGIVISGFDPWAIKRCVDVATGKSNGYSCESDEDCNPPYSYCATYGFQQPSNNITIEYNNITGASSGINSGGSYNTLQYNNCFGNYQHQEGASNACGISTMFGNNLIVRYNVSSATMQTIPTAWEGFGIFIDHLSTGSLCYGNISFSNDGGGIALRASKNIYIFNNIIYDNSRVAINDSFGGIALVQPTYSEAENNSLSGEVFNNIVLSDGRAEVRWLVPLVDGNPRYPSNPINLHHNCYYCDDCNENERFAVVAVGNLQSNNQSGKNLLYYDFIEWQQLLTDLCPDPNNCFQEDASIWEDPVLRNPPNQEFQLMNNSPCIDAGYVPNDSRLNEDYSFHLTPEKLKCQVGDYSKDFLSLNLSNQNDHGADWEMGAYVFCPGDSDCDSILDSDDNCPLLPNGPGGGSCTKGTCTAGKIEIQCLYDYDCDTELGDKSGICGLIGNSCENNNDCGGEGTCSMNQEDTDEDGIGDVGDNCPDVSNPNQEDADEDEIGDVCDNCPNDYANDADSDSICGDEDNCPDVSNPTQENSDEDEVGDVCDNCPGISNPNQEDTDEDEIGDVCDNCPNDYANDADSDSICGDEDNCPDVSNPNQEDADEDKIGNVCDNCPNDYANDADSDSICGDIDNCPNTPNPDQEDTYPPGGNGIGDSCECEADFDCDGNVTSDDIATFLVDFGRYSGNNPCSKDNPCNGDFELDGDVDSNDIRKCLEDFGRNQFNNPCPPCEMGD